MNATTKAKGSITKAPDNKIVLYTDKRGNVELRADVEKDTLWATLDQIAKLFCRDKSVISRHLRNIFATKELDKKATVAKSATVQIEAGRRVTRNIEYHNLDVILSVGYRVNSKEATQFRIWATGVLREYVTNGYALNRYKLEKVPENLKDMHEAIEFIESKSIGGTLKGKITVKLSKDLVPKNNL